MNDTHLNIRGMSEHFNRAMMTKCPVRLVNINIASRSLKLNRCPISPKIKKHLTKSSATVHLEHSFKTGKKLKTNA